MHVIRDPLWNNIRLDDVARRLVDTDAFQRLRYVRQLGLAYLVYPGASHSRFEHALGAYQLASRTITQFDEAGLTKDLDKNETRILRYAALLHDVGHYPFSHALEEIGALHHEEVARPLITTGAIANVLENELGAEAPEKIMDLIRGKSRSCLQGLISGSLDLDKIEYLKRDAFMCGVNYGDIDVDRLVHSLTLVTEPGSDAKRVGISEKGLSALESLLFAKYQMYRNVYWHHAVRSATAMYKRLVTGALLAGALNAETLATYTDEGLLHELGDRCPSPLLEALRKRKLYKRLFECPAAQLPPDIGEWIADDPALVTEVEDRLAGELGLGPGEVLLDYPAKTQMLGLDMPVLRRNGEVQRLTASGWDGAVNLPKLSQELYGSARWLRVFAVRRTPLPKDASLRLASLSADEVRHRMAAGLLLAK